MVPLVKGWMRERFTRYNVDYRIVGDSAKCRMEYTVEKMIKSNKESNRVM